MKIEVKYIFLNVLKQHKITPTVLYSMADEPKQCCMCVEDLTMGNIVTTECDHQFCKDCFWRWIKTKNSCPLCRKSLLKTDEEQKEQEHMRQMLDMRGRVIRDIEEGYEERDGLRASIRQLNDRNKRLTQAQHTMANICNEKENHAVELQVKIINQLAILRNLERNNVKIAKFNFRLNKKNMLRELKERSKVPFSLKHVEIRAQHEVASLYSEDKNSRTRDLPCGSRVRKRLRRGILSYCREPPPPRPAVYREIVRYVREMRGGRPPFVIDNGMVYERDVPAAPEAIDADRNDINDIEPIDINEYWNAPMPEVMVDIINDLMRMGDN